MSEAMSPKTATTMWLLLLYVALQHLPTGGPMTSSRVSSETRGNWMYGPRDISGATGSSSSGVQARHGKSLLTPHTKMERSPSQAGDVKKQQILSQIADVVQTDQMTSDRFYTVFEILTRLATSEQPITELEKATVSTILHASSRLASQIESRDGIYLYYLASGAVILISRGLFMRPNFNNINDLSIYEDVNDGFSIYPVETFSESKDRKFELVIHRKDESPFRPLPDAKMPILSYRVVDLFLGDKPVSDFLALSGLAMRWESEKSISNVRYGCQRWNDTDTTWSSQGCTLLYVLDLTNLVVCHCDIIFNGNYSEYVMYQYGNGVQETIHVDNLSLKDGNLMSTEYTVQRSVLYEILANQSGSDKYTNLNRYLSNVTLIFGNDLSNETADAISEDVGKILLALKPDESRHTIGYRNELLATFVVQSDLATKDDLPIGFGVYKNYPSGIECFMSTEEIDPNLLFSSQMNFSLLFSKSVVQQNSRYAFLVYPTDKYFKPTANINGEQVLNTRVVDVMLTPNHQEDIEDQFLHLFIGILSNTNLYDCAYWSSMLNDWSTESCSPNPRLYQGVCTCHMGTNFNKTTSRSQYIVFNYLIPKNYNPDPEVSNVYRNPAEEAINMNKVLHVNMYQFYPVADGALELMLQDVDQIVVKNFQRGNYYRLTDRERNELVDNVRRALITGEVCIPRDRKLVALCSMNTVKSKSKTAFYINDSRLYEIEEYQPLETLWADNEFVLHVSDSVVSQNERHSFLVHYKNAYLYEAPFVGQRVNSRVVDVILKPKVAASEEKQFVEFTFKKPAHYKLGCGVWDTVANDWTTHGCQIVHIGVVHVCNCSLVGNGSQYIVYSYVDREFDQKVFAHVFSETYADATNILTQGASLIRNASLLTFDKRLVIPVVQVFVKMVRNMLEVEDGQLKLRPVLSDIESAFDLFISHDLGANPLLFNFPGNGRVQWCPFSDDLLSSTIHPRQDPNGTSTDSDMVFAYVAVTDLYIPDVVINNGIAVTRTDRTEAQLTSLLLNKANVLGDNPLFACFYNDNLNDGYTHIALLVYPVNVSPYKYTMTAAPMFNSRQVDVFHLAKHAESISVSVYFQPRDEPEDYIRTACAVWDDSLHKWSDRQCLVLYTTRYESCICKLSPNSSVTRIIIYEYTEVPNFSLSYTLGGTSVVYLIGSTLSLIGQFMIAMTAILFPEWREETSAKIIQQLALSHFLYLALTMFRETHTIYVEMKNLNVSVVVFTVLVHYTRLVHHCWGLVMSVLDFKRFAVVVEESSNTNLIRNIGVVAWGVPLIPLIVLLSWDVREHFLSPSSLTYTTLYLVPNAIIILLNIGLLVRVIAKGCGPCKVDELQSHRGSKKDVHLQCLKNQVLLFFIFSSPVAFEALNNLVFRSIVVVYVSKVLDALQGFFVFLFFVLMDDKTRGLWNVKVFGDLPPVTAVKKARRKVIKRKIAKRQPTKLAETDSVDQPASVVCQHEREEVTHEIKSKNKAPEDELQAVKATDQQCEHDSIDCVQEQLCDCGPKLQEVEDISVVVDTCVVEVSSLSLNSSADGEMSSLVDLFDVDDICSSLLSSVDT